RHRIDYMSKVLKGKTAADMLKDQHQIIDDALAAHRCVFGIVTPVQEVDFRKSFRNGPYDVVELTRWNEPCSIKSPDPEDFRHPRTPLAPPTFFGEPLI